MKIRWDRFGGQLGVGFSVLGFIFIFLGWNGAASLDRLPSQFPYLLSGGATGMGLVIIGVGLMIIQSQRQDRAYLEARLTEIRAALERLGAATGHDAAAVRAEAAQTGQVIAGTTSYHRPTCHLIEDRTDAVVMSAEQARDRGLRACRICGPDKADGSGDADLTVEMTPAPASKPARRRARR